MPKGSFEGLNVDPATTENKKVLWPDSRILGEEVLSKYEIIEPTKGERFQIEVLLENFRTGKHLSNLCHQISKQERRPVFTINNARMGAMLQNGFQHWLANFSSKEQANEFISSLEEMVEYRQEMDKLNRLIEDFRKFLKDNNFPSEFYLLKDPSSNILLELLASYASSRGIAENKEFIKRIPEFDKCRPRISAYMHDSFQIKDKIRTLIFRQAIMVLEI
ncbi:MAG: hypothetical protein Q8P07_03535 [bacterium]|nr:hypothetical protein [bacterium]